MNIYSRWAAHTRDLHKGSHHSSKLQRAWDKYGECNFRIEIVLECPKENLLQAEEHAISAYDSYYNGYNGTIKAGRDATGIKHTPEFCKAISDRMKNRFVSPETRQKLRESHLGKKASAETLAKLSLCHMGNTNRLGQKASEETKQKMSKARVGRRISDESKQKISEANSNRVLGPMTEEAKEAHRTGALESLRRLKEETGETHWGPGWTGRHHSEETKELLRSQRAGVPISEKAKENISKAKKGKPGHKQNADTKEKIRQARINYWMKKKAGLL